METERLIQASKEIAVDYIVVLRMPWQVSKKIGETTTEIVTANNEWHAEQLAEERWYSRCLPVYTISVQSLGC